ncbi:MAG: glycoside hydrolase family 3 N-terminal domain-containing protein [Flavobacteriaceae bacterium]|nr:glycoside hydrolase family 3 N-terminal domain-containing protein [Flavobacteriaceae bacterium]
MFKKIVFACCSLFVLQTYAQKHPLVAADSLAQSKWVDSIMQKMTLDQKIGQLFMVASYSNRDQAHAKEIENLIIKYEIGGVIFFQGTIEGHAKLINQYQSVSKIPMLIGIDAEWGLNMRLENTTPFPYNMALGAIRDNQLIEEFGEHVGKHIKRLGMQIDFAPSVDINVNPENPIIGNRSFGEDRDNVTEKAGRFIKGMQGQQVLVSAKHFPGHGDTATDSHKALPVLDFSMQRLDSIELYPYRKLIPNGLTGVMVSHLSVPAIEPDSNIPTSISANAITKLLKQDMKFQGLIYTDALNMQGITSYVKPGEIDYAAFMAGNDVLLFAESVSMGHKKIKEAYEKKVITEERLDHSVRKILMAKYWAGLDKVQTSGSQ